MPAVACATSLALDIAGVLIKFHSSSVCTDSECMQALLHSYCCLDFASILDVTQLRLYKLRKLMKERVQNRCASGLSCSTCLLEVRKSRREHNPMALL